MENHSEFRILVIDDNLEIHHDFIKILTTSSTSNLDELNLKMFGKKNETRLLPNFQIDTASQGEEGVEYIKKAIHEGRPYSLAFVDIRMPPGWDGIETIKRIWALDKDIQMVICTAYSDYSWEETVAHLGKTDNLLILKKPFDNVSVRQLACALTKKWELLQDTRKFTSSLKQEVDDRTLSLQKSLSLVKATLESSDEGIIVVNEDEKIIDYNQKFCKMWNISEEEVRNATEEKILTHIKNQLVNPDHFITWLRAIQKESGSDNLDLIEFKDGKIFDCYSQPQILDGQTVGRVLNFRDITERTQLENELQYQAKHDALTGLPNRVYLLDTIRETIKDAEKNKTLFAVLFLDLDRFKLINDSLSHAVGDEVLCKTANRLLSIFRDEDLLTRLGGDEFVILLRNLKSYDDIYSKMQKLKEIFQHPFSIGNRAITITASIGISVYPQDGITADALLRNADSAMYNVKEQGSNHYQFYSPEMNARNLDKLDQEMQLRQAIANDELFLLYQPQFDLKNKVFVAAEALLRWKHPQKGILLPIDFVPLAEETGLIVPIGEWVIRTACQQNKTWQDLGFPPIRIAVNITGDQLKQQNIVEIIKSILKETNLKPEYLELELTENIIISRIEIIKTLVELKKLGIAIAIDDFGTGYSSLGYLKNIPLDRLKIDSSFIKTIESETDDEVIIRAIIALAKNLNLEVLAEGVETKNQMSFLENQKCDEIQGFYYSEPLTPKEVEKLFSTPVTEKEDT